MLIGVLSLCNSQLRNLYPFGFRVVVFVIQTSIHCVLLHLVVVISTDSVKVCSFLEFDKLFLC